MTELKRIANEDCELEMTPMIDVTFLLLIFFICTIKFKTLEGKLSAFLPKDVGGHPTIAEPHEKLAIVVTVLCEGTKLDPASAGALESRNPELVARWSGTSSSRFVFGADRVLQYKLGPHVTSDLAEVEQRLARLFERASASSDVEPALTVDPRAGVVYEDVVLLLDRAIDANYRDISFVGPR